MADSQAHLPEFSPTPAAAKVGYLWIPHLPLAVALRARPETGEQPTIIGGAGDDGLVVDASDDCIAVGVRIGQPVREVREFCPEATILPADPAADRRAHEEVLDLLETVVPLVEDDGPGRAYFLADDPVTHDEGRRFLVLVRTLFIARLGFRARLVLAPGKFAARTAAEHDLECAATGAPVVLADDDVRAYLAPLPIEVLPLAARATERLRRLGIRTVGQFAQLPRDALGRRFGAEAVTAHRLALGEDDRPVAPRTRPEVRAARHEFSSAVETVEPLIAVAERLLERLCAALHSEGKAFQSLTVAVEHETGDAAERTAALRLPAASLAQCRTMLRALVEAVARVVRSLPSR